MFKGKEKVLNNKKVKNTFIAKEIEFQGNLNGVGDVLIEGVLDGDISVTSIIIGEHGTVNGTITATNVIVNGKLNGSIFCDTLDIMPNGYVSNTIKVKKLLISGRVEGSVEAMEEIKIEQTGIIRSNQMKSETILINGSFKGNVTASQLLEIGPKGSVEGEITVKNIKTHEGGKLLGSMNLYVENKTTKESAD